MSGERVETAPRTWPLAIGYFIAEMCFDGFVAWLIFSRGHPWWALIWCWYAGLSCNRGVKLFTGTRAADPGVSS